ncbi:UDP-N-acetylmuramate--L-alanine ligase, partial [bacterium]|nr:UDP-N-acetylmuramate--L-alanine ligase [bacterium]
SAGDRVHLIGVGGAGMSGLARALNQLGLAVSGSDRQASPMLEALAAEGLAIRVGHAAGQLPPGCALVVRSPAIPEDNAELLAARAAGIPISKRAPLLGALMDARIGIAVAGTHGKTTTTSLIATVLSKAGLDPTVVVGGKLDHIGSNAKLGTSEYLVAEADESDGSFLLLTPTIGVVTNIEPEHMDYYKGLDQLKSTFEIFMNKVPFYGLMVLCIDQEHVQSLLPRMHKRYTTYGLSRQADLLAKDLVFKEFSTSFTAEHVEQGVLGRIEIGLPGVHNVYNSLAAIAVAMEMEVPFDQIASAIHNFSGVGRRFEKIGEAGGILVVDDYGHHPTEIKTTLTAAKTSFGRRVLAFFQPHRYSRTRDCYDEFLTAFNEADVLVVTDIYAANEKPLDGVTAQKLFDGIRACGHKNVIFEPDKEKLPELMAELSEPGDLVMTLGAGDITKFSRKFFETLKKNAGETKPADDK